MTSVRELIIKNIYKITPVLPPPSSVILASLMWNGISFIRLSDLTLKQEAPEDVNIRPKNGPQPAGWSLRRYLSKLDENAFSKTGRHYTQQASFRGGAKIIWPTSFPKMSGLPAHQIWILWISLSGATCWDNWGIINMPLCSNSRKLSNGFGPIYRNMSYVPRAMLSIQICILNKKLKLSLFRFIEKELWSFYFVSVFACHPVNADLFLPKNNRKVKTSVPYST
jgi:hypothetical protein